MRSTLVLTIIGKDRPGLVESVAGIIVRHGGNWLESRMARLGGHFAGILQIEVPRDHQSVLQQELTDLKSHGLTVVAYEDTSVAAPVAAQSRQIEIVGQDRPGIVNQITRALAHRGVNVEEFTSECVSAPMSGEPLFTARATVIIPSACDVADLQRELEKIGQDLIVEVTMRETKRLP